MITVLESAILFAGAVIDESLGKMCKRARACVRISWKRIREIRFNREFTIRRKSTG